ncbi:MAG: FtsX-like permease family protein [Phycisphaerae bacterium]|nr:FtsX-like permease family protein [Phycisphaerae bacterium]
MTDLLFILRSLRSRAFQTATTIATVAVAVGLMATLLSMRDAGRAAFRRGSGNIDLLLAAEPGPLVAVLNALFHAGAPANPIPFARYLEIRDGYPWAWTVPILQGDNYRGYPAIATTTDFFARYEPSPGQPWELAEGRLFERPFEVVLGADVAAATRIGTGGRILLTHGSGGSREGGHDGHVHEEYEYEVVGVLAPSGSAHDRALFTDLESSWVLHAFDRHEREGRHVHVGVEDLEEVDRQITGILLKVPSRSGSSVGAAIAQQFDRMRRESGLTVAQPAQEVGKLLAVVSNVEQLLLAMAGVVLLASGVGIMLSLTSSMDLRRRQVAIIRVLGASRGKVLAMTLTESALLGLGGAVAGILLAGVGNTIVAASLARQLGLVVPWSFDPAVVLGLVVGTTVLAALAGTGPAILAYRTPVAAHLRPIG